MEALGSRIRAARLAKGEMKQEDLAHLMEVNRTTVSSWERDITEPSVKVLGRLAAVLDTTPGKLVDPTARRPMFGADAVPVSFVPVVESLTPQGQIIDPSNVSGYYPFPATGWKDVIEGQLAA